MRLELRMRRRSPPRSRSASPTQHLGSARTELRSYCMLRGTLPLRSRRRDASCHLPRSGLDDRELGGRDLHLLEGADRALGAHCLDLIVEETRWVVRRDAEASGPEVLGVVRLRAAVAAVLERDGLAIRQDEIERLERFVIERGVRDGIEHAVAPHDAGALREAALLDAGEECLLLVSEVLRAADRVALQDEERRLLRCGRRLRLRWRRRRRVGVGVRRLAGAASTRGKRADDEDGGRGGREDAAQDHAVSPFRRVEFAVATTPRAVPNNEKAMRPQTARTRIPTTYGTARLKPASGGWSTVYGFAVTLASKVVVPRDAMSEP